MKTPGANFIKTALALSSLFLVSLSANGYAADGTCLQTQKQSNNDAAVVSSEQKANGHRWVTARILIKANPHVVWDTVHEERSRDPDLAYSKVLSAGKDQATLEQKFSLIPVIGTAVCVMKDTEVPYERIDYSMVSSDRFKAMEGSWVLSPGEDANTTYLELSSYCDIGLPIPRPMIESVTAKKIQRRLGNVKQMAESTQLRLAHATKVD